ncbi:hypothetical protein L3Q82_021666, partial [Scortum barcoo]
MRKITGKHLLCLFLLAFPLSWAEDTKKDARGTENDTVNNDSSIISDPSLEPSKDQKTVCEEKDISTAGKSDS